MDYCMKTIKYVKISVQGGETNVLRFGTSWRYVYMKLLIICFYTFLRPIVQSTIHSSKNYMFLHLVVTNGQGTASKVSFKLCNFGLNNVGILNVPWWILFYILIYWIIGKFIEIKLGDFYSLKINEVNITNKLYHSGCWKRLQLGNNRLFERYPKYLYPRISAAIISPHADITQGTEFWC